MLPCKIDLSTHQEAIWILNKPLLNCHSGTGVFIPAEDLIPTLLSAEKSELADAVQLFDLKQAGEIVSQAEQFLTAGIIRLESEKAPQVVAATKNLEFIKGYRIYLEDNA